MVTRHVIIAAWLLCPMAAYGQTQVLLINQTLLDNQRFYGPGSFTRTAISLSAGQALLGLGAGTTAIHSDATVTTGNFIACGKKHFFDDARSSGVDPDFF